MMQCIRRTVAATILLLFAPGLAFGHGVHANIVSPAEGAVLRDQMVVQVEKQASPFPYIHLVVRHLSSGSEVWSGLVTAGEGGYLQIVDLTNWRSGEYAIEVQFLGDPIEEKTKRIVKVKAS